MKKYFLFSSLILIAVNSAFSQCTALTPGITAADSIFCENDSTMVCASGSYTSYLWNTGDTTQCIYVTQAGGYWVTVTDNNGCTAISSHQSISVYPVPSVSILVQGDTMASFGAVTYQWYLNGDPIQGATESVYIAHQAGNYSVLITDANGCKGLSESLFINGSPQQFSVTLGQEQQVCAGSQIILNSVETDGSGNYQYSWASTGDALSCYNCQYPEAVITQQDVFSVTVTDVVYGTATASVQYSIAPPPGRTNSSLPVLSFTNTNLSCTQPVDTTIVSINDSFPSYQVNWGDNTAGTTSYSTNITHDYSQAGIYVISVSDSFNCVSSGFDTVVNNGIIITATKITEPSCATSNNGKISISVTGGSPPYTYSWQTGSAADSVPYLSTGSYMVTVTDAAYCSATDNFNLYSVDQDFYLYVQSTQANCNSNGSLIPVISGGAPPYSYLWSNNDTTPGLMGYTGGFYSLNVTDSLGCYASGEAYIYSGCYGIISGIAFVDSNNNCVFDSTEMPVGGITITATNNGQEYFGYTDNNGFYSIQVQGSGVFSLSANYYYYGNCGNLTLCNNSSQIITLAALGDSSTNNNFGFTGSSGFDLTLHPGWTSANPGFQKEYWTYYYNQAYTPYYGPATIIFTYDSNLIYQYSSPPLPVHDPIAHTLTYTVDSIPAGWSNRLDNFFTVPASLSLGYLLQSDFYITPTIGDCDSSNNHFHFSEIVTGSHDPNEKTVSPTGNIYYEDSMLTYTIHFQNTGTDSTNFIIVTDTLPQDLDPASVVNVASSSPYSKFTVSGTGILTWVFNPLHLVDSLTNPSGSKGFVMFTVKERPNRSIGAVISNQASIVFDYNSPIITNRATDTVSIVNAISSLSIATGFDVNIFPNPSADNIAIQVTGFTPEWILVYDVNGRIISQQKFIHTLDITPLNAGIYFIEVKGGDVSVRNRLVKL